MGGVPASATSTAVGELRFLSDGDVRSQGAVTVVVSVGPPGLLGQPVPAFSLGGVRSGAQILLPLADAAAGVLAARLGSAVHPWAGAVP